jgi:hypothetical protein
MPLRKIAAGLAVAAFLAIPASAQIVIQPSGGGGGPGSGMATDGSNATSAAFDAILTASGALIPLTDIAAQATNTIVGNATSGSASPTALAIGGCSTAASALKWTTNTGFECNTAIDAATLGGATFAAPGSIGSGTPGSGAFTTLSASSTVSGTGFSTYLASPPAIGGTAPAAGSFTTLSATGHVTAEGVTSTGATGTGKFVFDGSPTLVTPNLGTPSAATLTNATGLPCATGIANRAGCWIATKTANNTSGSISFTSSEVTGYNIYEVVINQLVPSAADLARMRIGQSGVVVTSGYSSNLLTMSSANSSAAGHVGSNSAAGTATGTLSTTAANGGVSGHFIFYNLGSSSAKKPFSGRYDYFDGTNLLQHIVNGLYSGNNTAIDSIFFEMNSGNWVSGTISLYGRNQ